MGKTLIRINLQTVLTKTPQMHGKHRRSAAPPSEAQRNIIKQGEPALEERIETGRMPQPAIKIIVHKVDKSLPKGIKALDAKILHSKNPLPPLKRIASNIIWRLRARPAQPILLRVLRTQDRLRLVHRAVPDLAVVGEAVDV